MTATRKPNRDTTPRDVVNRDGLRSNHASQPRARDRWTGTADQMRDAGADPVDRATCPHGGLLLTEDPDVFDCVEGCGE